MLSPSLPASVLPSFAPCLPPTSVSGVLSGSRPQGWAGMQRRTAHTLMLALRQHALHCRVCCQEGWQCLGLGFAVGLWELGWKLCMGRRSLDMFFREKSECRATLKARS